MYVLLFFLGCNGPFQSHDVQPDADGDTYTIEDGDCDDQNPEIHPDGKDDTVNGIDEDCDDVDGTDEDHDGYPALEKKGDFSFAGVNDLALMQTCD